MRQPRIELLCVGTELLSGQVNTHQAYLSTALNAAGLPLAREGSLPDDLAEITAAVREALKRSDALLLCGGLGPTFDDISREAVAAALGRSMRYRPALYARIKKKFSRYRLPVPEENKRQAFVIEGASVLPNPFGSAPGQLLRLRGGGSRVKLVALMPGPFSEMAPMFEAHILPRLRAAYARGRATAHLCVRMSGVPESVADEKLAFLTDDPAPGRSFTILSSDGQVSFHAAATEATARRAAAVLKVLRRRIYAAVGEHVFGEGAETLESAVGRRLRARSLTLAVAESCTGGWLGRRLTSVPGSSDYFICGVIAYSNRLKTKLLGVSGRTLARFGAVSSHCAREMAAGARRSCGATLGLSVTGVAGPGGGSRKKPVGLVYFGLDDGKRSAVIKARFSGNREVVRARAVAAALTLVLRRLKAPRAKEI
ncbi:MAG: CinA family nicotinamide mononucleotide deamidase-related protein [Elusimicrobia bacterium]|nr:CinA family nicotinamide mononucleotide deamidase-related protein [Elusimicrobiota bacterium]